MSFSIAFAAASAALSVQSAVPSQSPGLDPSGPWTVEVTEGTCLVGRKYSAAGSEITLGFRKDAAAGDLQILVWRAGNSTRKSKGKAQVALDLATVFEASYVTGPVNIRGTDLTQIAINPSYVGTLNRTQTLNVVAGTLATSFKLRGISGAMTALDDCTRKLPARQPLR
jgi:hypothetical protein